MKQFDLMWATESFVKRLVKFLAETRKIEGMNAKKIEELLNGPISMANELRGLDDKYKDQIYRIIYKIESYHKDVRKPLARFFLGEFQDQEKFLKKTMIRVSKIRSQLLKRIVDSGKSNS